MDFTLNQIYPTFIDYLPVYKISIQYTNPFKIYRTETNCVTYRMDGWMDGTGWTYIRTAVILYAHPPTSPPPIENGRGIKKIIQEYYQSVKQFGSRSGTTKIRPDILSGLIWIQTVCKGYQQTTKVATSRERVRGIPLMHF